MGTLTPSAVSGKNILFTSSTSVFFTSDVGRILIYGASRAVITSFGASAGDTISPNPRVRADILDVFPNTNPILAGLWFIRLSPQAALDADKKEPVGARITLVADKPTFRLIDVGKFILIHGGLVRINTVNSVTEVGGEILSELQTTDANPPSAPAGSWTLEEPAWGAKYGYPRTGEFFQGRLFQAATFKQPTTFWGSESGAFDRYGVGARADAAIDYTIASRQLNRIEWLADVETLLLGTSGAELAAKSGKSDEPLGGDIVPKVDKVTSQGSAAIQPITIDGRNIFVARGQQKIFAQAYSFELDHIEAQELTVFADHITNPKIRLGPVAFQKHPHRRLFYVRSDGVLLALTYFPEEKVVGFARIVTQGTFEAVACIPQTTGKADQVWVVVRRIINGVTRRYIEIFEDAVDVAFTGRAWQSLQTDCAVTYKGVAITTLTGLGHLEGMLVDVVADGGYIGTKTVAGGIITLEEAATEIEVGLHYNSLGRTMRPAIPDQVIEGIPRSWDKLWLRLYETRGGRINGEAIDYPADPLGTMPLYTGDVAVTGMGWDTDGRVTIEQLLPYPMTVLALFGTLSLGDND